MKLLHHKNTVNNYSKTQIILHNTITIFVNFNEYPRKQQHKMGGGEK